RVRIGADELSRIDTCWSIGYALVFIDTLVGHLFCMRALLLALSTGELERITRCIMAETAMTALRGSRSWRRTQRLIAQAADLARRSGTTEASWFSKISAGTALYLSGRFRQAAAYVGEALEMTQDSSTGLTWERVANRTILINSLLPLGRFRELRRLQQEGLR